MNEDQWRALLKDEQSDANRRVDRQILRNAEMWADLRAKVEALPAEHHYGKTDCVGRADVLALFDGGSDD